MVIDTQILIEASRGRGDVRLSGASIASTTALEFLGMERRGCLQPEYYVPLQASWPADLMPR